MEENKLKHLDLIQSVINRMASNSFLIKGWTITLVSALIALAASNSRSQLILLALLPTIMFWILDGYFLRQERLFRGLFDHVRVKGSADVDFSMDTNGIKVANWMWVILSKTLLLFYGFLFVAIVLIYLAV